MKTIRKTKLLMDNITVFESVIKEKDRYFYNVEIHKGREILSINERKITDKEYDKLIKWSENVKQKSNNRTSIM